MTSVRGTLSRDLVLATALAVADAEGLDAVSMRSVAARLGVQAMSLYHHVPSKAALVDGLHERLLLELDLDVAGASWDEVLRRVAAAFRTVALTHPKVFVLLATRPVSTPAAVTHLLPVLAALEEAGLDPDTVLRLLNVFLPALSGILVAEVSPVPGHDDVPEPDADALGPALPAPLAAAVARADSGSYLADHFDEAVAVLLAGLRTVVTPGTLRPDGR